MEVTVNTPRKLTRKQAIYKWLLDNDIIYLPIFRTNRKDYYYNLCCFCSEHVIWATHLDRYQSHYHRCNNKICDNHGTLLCSRCCGTALNMIKQANKILDCVIKILSSVLTTDVGTIIRCYLDLLIDR